MHRFAHAAAAEHRDAHRLLDARQHTPVRTADVGLCDTASMDIHRSGSRRFGAARHIHRSLMLPIRPAANFQGDRNPHSRHDRSHDPANRRRVRKQRTAFAAIDQPANRTLEVQIDEAETAFLDHAGRLGHHCWIRAADLPGARPLFGCVLQQAQGAPVPPRDIDSVDALGTNEAGAKLLHEQPERMIGVLLHWSKSDGMSKTDGTDSHDCRL